MRWSRALTLVGVHAEGEIGRIVTGGLLPPPGRTMQERLAWLNGTEEGEVMRDRSPPNSRRDWARGLERSRVVPGRRV